MLVAASLGVPRIATAADEARIRELEQTVRALRDEVQALRTEQRKERVRSAETGQQLQALQSALGRVRIGGYGALRWESSSLRDVPATFTFRRLVLTTAAEISPRLRFYSELEYERFRKLELERRAGPSQGGLLLVQEVEGTDQSEIALEQAWVEFDLSESTSLRAGGLLVPLGRFNRDHDDNRWNLTRRTLVDRGAPVLPAAAAWDELGAGLLGTLPLGEGEIDWELYVVNGATLEAELEEIAHTRSGRRDKIELEGEFVPQTGTFGEDIKEAKALAGRVAWRPAAGQEVALSFYHGRYTPSYLADEAAWALAFDGITRLGGLEIEGEYVHTRFEDTRSVAQSFAAVALEKETTNPSAFDPILETEIEFEIDGLADTKHGYWIELRYPFWPSVLDASFLGRGFAEPRLIPVLRWEQVFYQDRVVSLDFTGGVLTDFQTESRVLSRLTLGLAYRPTPLAAFTLAYEYLFADEDSLDGLTLFLPSGVREDAAHIFTVGATFGF